MNQRWLVVCAALLGVSGNGNAGTANCAGIDALAQGDLVVHQAPSGSTVRLDARPLRVSSDGWYVFGIGRDASKPVTLEVQAPGTAPCRVTLPIHTRNWAIERVNGVPQATVSPPPEIARRIAREQQRVAATRSIDSARGDFIDGFIWPVSGRISGHFGSQRIYNGEPRSPHSGVDIAANQGVPVKAPAAGRVIFADPDLYLTGGTVLIDHGHGVNSSFLHLSRLDVHEGQQVQQGETIGAVGATGRATGPHLHWGLNWFDVRLDPEALPPR
ncbi:MAG: M23 family metallopeptidase [Xanthomonadales bacterium]|nr:M23 family metallopeptidase [Xanthomonadales bacterium]MDZ4115072.1 M23 family metallopeptidase [Xanthomonadaceae bacterium]